MEDKSTQDMLVKFEAELADAEREATRAVQRLETVRGVVASLRQYIQAQRSPTPGSPPLFDPVEPESDEYRSVMSALGDDAPRGREAVRRILIEDRGIMHISAMVRAALEKGWMRDVRSPRNALTAAANRLIDDGEVERGPLPATYRYRVDKLPPVPIGEGDA